MWMWYFFLKLRWLPAVIIQISILVALPACNGGDLSISEKENPEGRTARGVVNDLKAAGSAETREKILSELKTAKRGDRLDFKEFWTLLAVEEASVWLVPGHSTSLFSLESRSCEEATFLAYAEFAASNEGGRRHLISPNHVCGLTLDGKLVIDVAKSFISLDKMPAATTPDLVAVVGFLKRELIRQPVGGWFDHVEQAERVWMKRLAEELTHRSEVQNLLDLVLACQQQLRIVPFSDFLRARLFTDATLVLALIQKVGIREAIRSLYALSRDGENRYQQFNQSETADVVNLLLKHTFEKKPSDSAGFWDDYSMVRALLANLSRVRWTRLEKLALSEKLHRSAETWLNTGTAGEREAILGSPSGGSFGELTELDRLWLALRTLGREHHLVKLASAALRSGEDRFTDPVDQILEARIALHLVSPTEPIVQKQVLESYCDTLKQLQFAGQTIAAAKLQDSLKAGLTPGCFTVQGGLFISVRIPRGTVIRTPLDTVLRHPGGTISVVGGGKLEVGFFEGTLN